MMSTFSLAALLCCFAASLCIDLDRKNFFLHYFFDRACHVKNGVIVKDVCFYVPRQLLKWDEAVAFCEADIPGGKLAYPESNLEFKVMLAVCEDYSPRKECFVGLIHQRECNYVAYDNNKIRVPHSSPWWENGRGMVQVRNGKGEENQKGIVELNCNYYNRGEFATYGGMPTQMGGFVGKYKENFICKVKRDPV